MSDMTNQAGPAPGQVNLGSPATAPFQYAGFFVWAMAFMVDGIIAAAISGVLGTVFGLEGFAWAPLSGVVSFGYDVLLTAGRRQATIGKRLMGLVVVTEMGTQLTYGRAAWRHLSRLVSSFFFGLGFIWVLFDGERQGWHDHLAGTYVIHGERR